MFSFVHGVNELNICNFSLVMVYGDDDADDDSFKYFVLSCQLSKVIFHVTCQCQCAISVVFVCPMQFMALDRY